MAEAEYEERDDDREFDSGVKFAPPCPVCKGSGEMDTRPIVPAVEWEQVVVETASALKERIPFFEQLAREGRLLSRARYELTALRVALQEGGF